MILYHGSTLAVPEPLVTVSRGRLDFGPGFYLTSIRSQAENWARRKALLARDGSAPLLNSYEYRPSTSLSLKNFPANDAEWVEFVCACRKGRPIPEAWDIIVGGVADDQVFQAVNLYLEGFFTLEQTIRELSFYERNDQWCFRTQRAVAETLAFRGAEEVVPND